MDRRKVFSAVLMVMLCLCTVTYAAEVHINEPVPEDWARRDLLRITVFPILASDAMLVECGGQTMLIDGGTKGWGLRVARGLKQLGIDRLDYVFNTHPDPDHIGGVTYALRMNGLDFGTFMSTFPEDYNDRDQKALVQQLRAHGIPYRQLSNHEVIGLGRAKVTIMYDEEARDNNNWMSAAARITLGDASILLTADMLNSSLQYLTEHFGTELPSDILKVPHHGLCRMDSAFVRTVGPQLLFITNIAKDVDSAVITQIRNLHLPCLYDSRGPIVMETDGTVWYVSQDTALAYPHWPQ